MLKKRIVSLLMTAAVAITYVPIPVSAENNKQTVEYIVKYKAQSSAMQNMDADAIQILDEIESDNENIVTQLISIDTYDTDETLKELNNTDEIILAEPNSTVYAMAEPEFSKQWALNGIYGINPEKAWELSKGEGVTVAVIDTGVDINHCDLTDNIFTNESEIQDGLDNDGNGYKDDIHGWNFSDYTDAENNGNNSVYKNAEEDTHGTHIAGIISAGLNEKGIAGVAPEAKILPVKFMKGDKGTLFNAIKSIEYAEMMGARIANCSWGIERYSQFLYDAINNSDMLFVCAAGNDGNNMQEYPCYPAAYNADNIISVAASDENGKLAEFSNYGAGTDIAAPGKNIYSTLPENSYGILDGTSMAAPFVSGAAALLLSINAELTAEEISGRIIQTAVNSGQESKIPGSIADVSRLLLTSVIPADYADEKYGSNIVTVNGDIYSVGGYDGVEYSGAIERFNPADNTWHKVTDIPNVTVDFGIAAYNDKIYIIGGFNEAPTDYVQIYDPASGVWTNGAAMPKRLSGFACGQLGDEVYVFGGSGMDGYRKSVYKYNISNNTWQTMNDMPYKTAYVSAAIVKSTIYIIGGSNENGVLDEIYAYNSSSDEFNYVSKLNVCRRSCAAAVMNDRVYIFGGSNSYDAQGINKLLEYKNAEGAYAESLTDTVEVFIPDKKTCSIADRLPKPIMGISALNYFDNIYLMGGWSGAYEKNVRKYFGAAVPKSISVRTSDNRLKIKWNPVSGATAYKIEIDGTVYETEGNSYVLTVSGDDEHKIRVQAISGSEQSLWSDYIFHYSNSTMSDAKVIAVNSQTNDKLYKTGQIRWYKIDNAESGKLTVSLRDVPQNCSYLIQLCNTSGEVIATGEDLLGVQTMKNVVLSPCPYYIKVTSLYGGDENTAYNLVCAFVTSSEENIPDRVRSAFLKPSELEDLSAENGMKPLSEYDGSETPVSETETKRQTRYGMTGGECGSKEYVPETVDSDDEMMSAMSIKNYTEETGVLNSEGSTATGSITVPKYTPSSSQMCKVAIEVVPEVVSDVIQIEWTGKNTEYNNFWYLFNEQNGNFVYYLTARIGRLSQDNAYNYKVTLTHKANGSSGRYTIRKYIICDSSNNEDYNNSVCGNETPRYAESAVPARNSSIEKTGKIDHPYDRDYYYITASSDEKITAYLESPSGKKYSVSIFDNRCSSDEQKVSEFMSGVTDDGISYATIKGKTSALIKYCIRVGSEDGSFSYDDTYTLHVYRYDISKLGSIEMNNSFDEADGLKTKTAAYIGTTSKIAAPISFCIDSPIDVDYYAVDMSAGEKLSVKMDLPSTYNDTTEKYRIEIYSDVRKTDENITYTSRSYDNPDTSKSKYVTLVANTAGTYYVAVKSLTRKYHYLKHGTLTITKTAAACMDSYETKGEECSNDFARITVMLLLGYEFFVDGCTSVQTPVNANFDNELDVDWYKFENGSESKTAVIAMEGENISSAAEVIVLDAEFDLLTAGVSGNTYTFIPNETYYIAAFVKDNKYTEMMSDRNYSISVSLSELRNDLVFKPLDWGTFLYDNSPEHLLEMDLADEDLGNRALINAENLSGVVDIATSHLIRPETVNASRANRTVSFDYLLYNSGSEEAVVTLERYGMQTPYYNRGESETDNDFACVQAWSDYVECDLNEDKFIGNVLSSEDWKYKSYKHNSKYGNIKEKVGSGGSIKLQPGEIKWLLGDVRPTIDVRNTGYPFFMISRINIKGTVDLMSLAFNNINNVHTPRAAKLYPTLAERTGAEINEEGDIEDKCKGISNSVAETESEIVWDINEDSISYRPTIYNLWNDFKGHTVYKYDDVVADIRGKRDLWNIESCYIWYTHINPTNDEKNYHRGVGTDMLEFTLNDENHCWKLDTIHKKAVYGNGVIKHSDIADRGYTAEAISMGNFSVIERYKITLNNNTDKMKHITYLTNTSTTFIYSYFVNGEYGYNMKCPTSKFYGDKLRMQDILFVDLEPYATTNIILEVTIPNIGTGGIANALYVE